MLWGERDSKVFRGVERDPRELWASISKTFCNYSIGVMSHSWCLLFFVDLVFFYVRIFFHFFS